MNEEAKRGRRETQIWRFPSPSARQSGIRAQNTAQNALSGSEDKHRISHQAITPEGLRPRNTPRSRGPAVINSNPLALPASKAYARMEANSGLKIWTLARGDSEVAPAQEPARLSCTPHGRHAVVLSSLRTPVTCRD